MKIKKHIYFLVAFILLLKFSPVFASGNDQQEIQDAVANFYSALNLMFTGDAKQMKEVWSHSSDITYMGPMGGLNVGWEQVQKIWNEQAALKLGGKVEPQEMKMNIGNDLAITSNYEMGENTNANGESQKVKIRATNIFRKESGKWKMIGHHTDLLPYLAKTL